MSATETIHWLVFSIVQGFLEADTFEHLSYAVNPLGFYDRLGTYGQGCDWESGQTRLHLLRPGVQASEKLSAASTGQGQVT